MKYSVIDFDFILFIENAFHFYICRSLTLIYSFIGEIGSYWAGEINSNDFHKGKYLHNLFIIVEFDRIEQTISFDFEEYR